MKLSRSFYLATFGLASAASVVSSAVHDTSKSVAAQGATFDVQIREERDRVAAPGVALRGNRVVPDVLTSHLRPTQSVQTVSKELVTGKDIRLGGGNAVAVHGNLAVVGAPENENLKGAAFVFVKDANGQWWQLIKLKAPDGSEWDRFGYSVGIHNETIVVGAIGDDVNGENSGSAHVFVWNGAAWAHQQKLLAHDGAAQDYFGTSVGIDGETIVVGAWGDDDKGEQSGSAHVFVRSGTSWTRQEKLLAPDGDGHDLFGMSVGVFGDTAIVGADEDDDNGVDSGSAHVFVRNGSKWSHQEKLLAPDGAAYDWFGRQVGIYEDTVVVSSLGDDDDERNDIGSVHIYERNGAKWSHQQKIVDPDAVKYGIFGDSVGIYGNKIVVGADGDNVDGFHKSGSALVYIRDGTAWILRAKLLAPERADGDECGYVIAVHNGTTIVGCGGNGKSYVFSV